MTKRLIYQRPCLTALLDDVKSYCSNGSGTSSPLTWENCDVGSRIFPPNYCSDGSNNSQGYWSCENGPAAGPGSSMCNDGGSPAVETNSCLIGGSIAG